MTSNRSSPTVRVLAIASAMGMWVMRVALQHDQLAELALVGQVDGRNAVARGQHAVEGCGCAAALRVAQVDRAGLEAGALFDLLGQRLPDAAESRVSERVLLLAHGQLAFDVRQLRALGDDDDGELLAAFVARLYQPALRHRCQSPFPGRVPRRRRPRFRQ